MQKYASIEKFLIWHQNESMLRPNTYSTCSIDLIVVQAFVLIWFLIIKSWCTEQMTNYLILDDTKVNHVPFKRLTKLKIIWVEKT